MWNNSCKTPMTGVWRCWGARKIKGIRGAFGKRSLAAVSEAAAGLVWRGHGSAQEGHTSEVSEGGELTGLGLIVGREGRQ